MEALVWLTDIAGLSRKEAVQLMRWSAAALLMSALADAGVTGHHATRARKPKATASRLSRGPKFLPIQG